MSELRYCPNCCQNVHAITGIDHTALIVLLILGVFPGLIYALILSDSKHCPICHTPDKDLEPPERPRRPTPELMGIDELNMKFDDLMKRM